MRIPSSPLPKVCTCMPSGCQRGPSWGRAGTKSAKKWVPALARPKTAPKTVDHRHIFPKSHRPQRGAVEKSQARRRFWMPVCVFRLTSGKTMFVFLVVSHPIVPLGRGIRGVVPSAFARRPRHQGERLQPPGKAAEHSRGSTRMQHAALSEGHAALNEGHETCGNRRLNETR